MALNAGEYGGKYTNWSPLFEANVDISSCLCILAFINYKIFHIFEFFITINFFYNKVNEVEKVICSILVFILLDPGDFPILLVSVAAALDFVNQ